MGLMDLFRRRSSAAEPNQVRASTGGQAFQVDDITSSQELAEFLRTGMETKSGEAVGPREAMAVAAVYRCTNLLCGVIGGVPIDIKDEDTLEVNRKHRVRKLLNRRPNRWQTSHEFRKMLSYALLMRGNGYARKVRDVRDGGVIALLPMHPDRTEPRQKITGEMEYEHIDNRGRDITLKQEDVFHVRGLSVDGVKGMGVLQHAREAIGMSRAAEAHGASMFRNGARVSGAFSHPQRLSDEAYDRMRALQEEFASGGDREGGAFILEEGLKYEAFGMTADEAQFIESRKFSVLDICMFFGVPPHMVGFTEKSTSWGSGIEQQSIGFVNYTLNDWFEAWEGAIERDLLTDDEEIADFNTYPLLRGDEKGRWEANRIKLEMGAYNADEVRRDEGKPARSDGAGGRYYDPPNVPQEGNTDDTIEPAVDPAEG